MKLKRSVRPSMAPLLGAVLLLGASAVDARAQDLARAVGESFPTNLNMINDAANAAVDEMFISFRAPRGVTLLVESETDHEARWFIENLILARLTEAGYSAYLKAGSGTPGEVAAAAETETRSAPPKDMAEAMRLARERDAAQADSAAQADGAAAGEEAGSSPPAKRRPRPGAPGETGPPLQVEGEGPAPEYVFRFRVAECALTYPRSYRKSPLGSRIVQRLASVSLYATLVQGEREDVLWVGNGDAERLDHVPAGKLPLLEGKTFPFSKPVLNARGLGAYVEPALVTGIVAGLIYLFYTNQN